MNHSNYVSIFYGKKQDILVACGLFSVDDLIRFFQIIKDEGLNE